MANDDINTKYRLLEQIASGSVRSYTAQERASGRPLLVHFVDDPPPSGYGSVLQRLDRLPPQDKPQILDSARVGGATVVITPVLDGFSSLEDWVQTKAGPTPRAGGTAGEQPSSPADVARSGDKPSLPVDQIGPAASSASEPGEYTRLFASPVPPSRSVAYAKREPPPPADEPSPAATSGSEPGDFTRLFAQSVSPPPTGTGGKEEGVGAASHAEQDRTGPVPLLRLRVPTSRESPRPAPPQLPPTIDSPFSPPPAPPLPLGGQLPTSILRPELRRTAEALSPPPTGAPLPLPASGYIIPQADMPDLEYSPLPPPAPTFMGAESVQPPTVTGSEAVQPAPGPSDFTRIIGGAPTPRTELSPAPTGQAAPAPVTSTTRRSILVPVLVALVIIEAIVILLML